MLDNNCHGFSALHIAVNKQNRPIVEQIIHADPRTMHKKRTFIPPHWTPFQMAVKTNQLEMVKQMMSVDAKAIEQRDFIDRSILHFATDPDLVMFLLMCKPTLIDAIDMCGNTPLHYHLTLCGANTSTYSRTAQMLLLKKPMLLNTKNNKGRLALETAHEHGLCHVVETYLRFDPNIQYYDNGCDEHGDTVLHLVASDLIIDDTDLLANLTRTRQSELFVMNKSNKTPLAIANIYNNTHAANQYRLYCPLDDTIANYHTYSPSTNIDAWALEQCSMLNNYLVSDLVFLTLTYLGIYDKNNNK